MDKLEYLALMLNQRTNGKKYENFVINAIYARIANLELIPETQKYVKNPHYILFIGSLFPSIKLWYRS